MNGKAIIFGMILLALAAIACKPDPSKDYAQVYQLEMLIDLLPYVTPGVTVYTYSCIVAAEKCHNFYFDTRELNDVHYYCHEGTNQATNCRAENAVGACVQVAINYLGVQETVYYSPAHTTDSARELCPSVTLDYLTRFFLDSYTIKNVWPR